MKGRAILLASGTRILPFGDPVGEAHFSGQTLAEHHDEVFRRLGLELVRAPDAATAIDLVKTAPAGSAVLLLLDRVFITEKAVTDFMKAAKATNRPVALALTINASVEYLLPLQDLRREGQRVIHDVLLLEGGASLPPPLSDATAFIRSISATPVEVPKREIVTEVPLPTIGEGLKQVLRYPITSTVVASIEHWVHVLWLNQIAFGIRWVELIRRHPLWAIFRVLTAFSLNRDKLLDRLVWRGPKSRIHPSAKISASIIGAGVKIGANVTVRTSIIGDGTVIEDHAVLLNCAIGPRNLITSNAFLVSCASYPDATIGNTKMQVCLVGKQAYVNAWSHFVDAKFVGHVKVDHKGELVSTERSFLGSVIGHRAKMAAKVLIQPGRAVPNDTLVVMRPDEVVSVVPDNIEPGVPYVRDRGTLVPLGKEHKS